MTEFPSLTHQKQIWRCLPIWLMAIVLALMLSACNQSTGALSSAKEANEKTEAETAAEQEKDDITRQAPTVTQKGTTIKAIVNGTPITSYDVKRRAAFLRLRRAGSNRNEKALEELVEQELKLQEARRINTIADDKSVDVAFANFAKGNKSNVKQMSGILKQAGVGTDHFREFLRTQLSWRDTISRRYQAEAGRTSERDAVLKIKRAGGQKPKSTEYKLQQFIFVIPAARRKAVLATRRKEANAMREQFNNCNQSVALAKTGSDVTFRRLGRFLEPELPLQWKEYVIATPVNQATPIVETAKGIEFLAVCSKNSISDDRVAAMVERENNFSEIDTAGSDVAQKYLIELRERGQIVYR